MRSLDERTLSGGLRPGVAVTVDLDWAPEVAIEETLEFLRERQIPVTVFSTHRSAYVSEHLSRLEVGLHPYFAPDSSHGATIQEVVQTVTALPHNLPAFRCHRFAVSNGALQALRAAGMEISSNVCTDMELLPPFRDRFRMLEVPIFLEDGGYLFQQRPLEVDAGLERKLRSPGVRVLLLHPMHFAINTPHFDYMRDIKRSVSRRQWNQMTRAELKHRRWRGRGVRDFLIELLASARRLEVPMTTLGGIARARSLESEGLAPVDQILSRSSLA
jgi:hypothetical protein